MDRDEYREQYDTGRTAQQAIRRVYNILRAAIADGRLPPGAPLSEPELCRELQTSRTAVRHALRTMSADGLVARAPRRGTVVVRAVNRLPLRGGFPQDSGLVSRTLETRLVSCSPLLAARLDTDDVEVEMSEYLLVLHGEPVGVQTAYCRLGGAEDYEPDLVSEDLAEYFTRRHGGDLADVQSTVEARLCDYRTSVLLAVDEGAPVLVRERLLVATDGRAAELSYTTFRADRVALATQESPASAPATAAGRTLDPVPEGAYRHLFTVPTPPFRTGEDSP
ncbi:GntR family transcriptional regulator [Pseudonocardia pini]|uniref:GntR family transcriptional regulator n=1 Tax=Pseudonocardia pini TaxID=2758030 RepID=UPI0015F01770|nr:GntR family transcriptional regulator [Pseudonocardia pini]